MGNFMAKGMDDNRIKMMESQKLMMIRQRETMMAVEIAKAKDRFGFYCGFYGTVVTFGTLAALKLRNPAPLIGPLIPTTWALAFQYDMIYGNKMERILAEADRLLMDQPELFRLPKASLMLDDPNDYQNLIMNDRNARNELIKTGKKPEPVVADVSKCPHSLTNPPKRDPNAPSKCPFGFKSS